MKDKEFGYAMKALRMVIRREWHRMTSRRLYLGVCVVLPLLCLFFMATIFGNGQMENIPVGIVDLDNTATSRNISQRISAAPTFRVTEHFTDEANARRALQRKDIYGYLVIPPRFEQKAVTGTGRECAAKLVFITVRVHPFPFRTRKLSSPVPKILVWRRTGKIGQCQHKRLDRKV